MSQKIKFVAFVAASIDGRIAKDSRSGTDWTSREDGAFFQKSLSRADAVIVGRHTYELFKPRLDRRNTIVFTGDTRRKHRTTLFLDPRTSDVKRILESKNYKTVAIAGGARVYDYCLRHGMLDELFVTIEPLVFTTGVPMFSGAAFKKHAFVLKSVKKLNERGTLLLKYAYAH